MNSLLTTNILKKMEKRIKKLTIRKKIIAVVPAAGNAKRIFPLPCSKELFPIGFQTMSVMNSLRPKVVCHYLLEKMHFAGISNVYIILRNGKWDIPAYFRDGKMLKMNLAYLMMDLPYGVPYTLDKAYSFVQDAVVAFGFPDIIFKTEDAYMQLFERLAETNADVVLGLFPTTEPHKKDMVDLDKDGRIRLIDKKPQQTHLHYTLSISVWTHVFTCFMHEYLINIQGSNEEDSAGTIPTKHQELTVGDIIQAAINKNLKIEGVVFSNDYCLDIGTPDDLVKAVCNII